MQQQNDEKKGAQEVTKERHCYKVADEGNHHHSQQPRPFNLGNNLILSLHDLP